MMNCSRTARAFCLNRDVSNGKTAWMHMNSGIENVCNVFVLCAMVLEITCTMHPTKLPNIM